MDLEFEVFNVRMKGDAVRIVDWIGSDRRRFRHLMDLFLHGEFRVTQQSAWIIGLCFDRQPQLITPWLQAMIKRMQDPDLHDAVKRNVVRILQFVDVPKALLGTVVFLCFDHINSNDTPIAVKANAMTVLVNAAERVPALRHELEVSLELLLSSPIPAVGARARLVLKRLQRLETHAPCSHRKKRSPDFHS